jgi:hypothetical protein
MQKEFEARWISKQRLEALRKAKKLGGTLVLDTYNGFLIVQPADSDLGDGAGLTREEADYELQPVWFLGPRSELREARRKLGLEAGTPAPGMAQTTA